MLRQDARHATRSRTLHLLSALRVLSERKRGVKQRRARDPQTGPLAAASCSAVRRQISDPRIPDHCHEAVHAAGRT
ncbi:hypothetical protein CBOM_08023 [Ceraceosorus bombacis]|uniref:Uncharacterized protein n=1 Tax=Ceraceosorus bombacis TaxID=401625 RepID=A0A0P1BT62_9BASI|nr:hypothetical protein CBOM_08023 [Ceraceosorus bombacis]